MPAGRFGPEPPESEGDDAPPAGTAPAPPAGVTGRRPFTERDGLPKTPRGGGCQRRERARRAMRKKLVFIDIC